MKNNFLPKTDNYEMMKAMIEDGCGQKRVLCQQEKGNSEKNLKKIKKL